MARGEDAFRHARRPYELELLMARADLVMLCGGLLRGGIPHWHAGEPELSAEMDESDPKSIEQLKGSMSQKNRPDAGLFKGAHALCALISFKPE